MTFAEFDAVCDGFERFHTAPEKSKPKAPGKASLYRALGIRE